MPLGPNGEKRPADVIGAAHRVAQIGLGEARDSVADPTKVHHQRGGVLGGHARAKALSAEQRSEIAKKAAAKRWNGSGS